MDEQMKTIENVSIEVRIKIEGAEEKYAKRWFTISSNSVQKVYANSVISRTEEMIIVFNTATLTVRRVFNILSQSCLFRLLH